MKVRDLLQVKGSAVITIHPQATLYDALTALVHHRIGSLVVLDDAGKVAGIITERDLLRECLTRGEQLKALQVRDVMTTHLIIGVPEDQIGYVMGIMTQNRIRRLPIMQGQHLEGLISIGDVVKAQLEETEFENRYLKEYIQRQ
ncbi:MAG TPA: CBS domain-containing protein [Methylomirabilota bacterium]|jgi:CBS domain-containing protein|nr:CBS domain-containing protein [Methylomirabilota bacterium]